MPKTPTPKQEQRAEIRRLRGSVLRLETTLQSGRLYPAEVVLAERELRRATNALARALRRGQVGRPRINPEVPPQGAPAHSAAAPPKRQPAEHGEPGHLCDVLCRLLGLDDRITMAPASVADREPMVESEPAVEKQVSLAPSSATERAVPVSALEEAPIPGADLIALALNPPTRDRGLRKGRSKNIPAWAWDEYTEAIKPKPHNEPAAFPTFGIPGL